MQKEGALILPDRKALSVSLLLLGVVECSGGIASWYGEEHRGKLTANGERFNPDAFTCASWHYPFGTLLIVRAGDKSVLVRVNDRGPAKRLGREIDLSLAAFRRLSDPKTGLVRVTVTKWEN